MPSRPKPNPPDHQAESAVTFESTLAELEAIVRAMEDEDLPLEDLVTSYEKGTLLLRRCETVLASAKERLELITLRNQAENALDSDASSVHGGPAPAGSPGDESDDDDDIRLF